MNNNLILTVLVVLVLCYSFFSCTETAFSSLNIIKLKALANNGNKKAEATLKLADEFSKLLTTVLIGNTIVNVVAASLGTLLFTKIIKDPEKGVAVSSVVMTLVIMIIGEIIPKNLAKSKPESFAMSVTPICNVLVLLFTPLSFLFGIIEKLMVKENNDDSYSTDEILTIVEEANEEGDIEDHEADLITNALEFNDLDVGEIFTPRIDVVAIDINEDKTEDIERIYRDSGYSRLPVYDESMDNIIGVLHEKDFYYHLFYEKKYDIKSILQPVIYTSSQVKISSLLKQFQKSKSHLAIVVDEYGGTEGIITMEDILEELVGEIYDEHDEVIEYYTKISDNEYLVKADLPIDDLFEHFMIDNDEDYEFNTTSAWVIDMFDRIPTVGEKFDYDNMTIEVTDADEKLVHEIKITFHDIKIEIEDK